MELFGFPMERFDEFRRLVVSFFNSQASNEVRNALAQHIWGHLTELIRARMAEPRDDIISKIMTSVIDGRRPSFDALSSICFTMFIAAAGTVSTQLSFGIRPPAPHHS